MPAPGIAGMGRSGTADLSYVSATVAHATWMLGSTGVRACVTTVGGDTSSTLPDHSVLSARFRPDAGDDRAACRRRAG